MNIFPFTFADIGFHALPSGALWWPAERALLVADLHLGKSERMARRGGALLPPYETAETLDRLATDIAALAPAEIICLGDSFDDAACATALAAKDRSRLMALQARCRWVWIAGNHDPAVPGTVSQPSLQRGALVLHHIAQDGPLPPQVNGEISGHFHPKHQVATRGGRLTRPCFLVGQTRLILPAYGAYTGGLATSNTAFAPFREPGSHAILTGPRPVAVPL
jgi:DNA ligase-associated metallophosphoesterase